MFYVVLDTNIFVRDYSLRGPEFAAFRSGLAATAATLLVPSIVLQEVTNKFSEHIEDLASKATAAVERLGRLPTVNLPSFALDLNATSQSYNLYLLQELTRSFSARFLDMPSITHQDLVNKALKRKKPFSKEGNGYRDSLIWCSILDELREHKTSHHYRLIFVTSNTLDFHDHDRKALHSDLRADLVAQGSSEDAVVLHETLSSLNKIEFIPRLQKFNEVRDLILNGAYKSFDLREWIQEKIRWQIDEEFLKKHVRDIPLRDIRPSYVAAIDIERVEMGDVTSLFGDDFAVDVFLKLSVYVNFNFIGSNDKEEELTSFIDSHDGDWFDEKKFTVKLPIEIEVFILIDEKTGEIADSEFR